MPAGLVGKVTMCMKYSACTMHHLIFWDMNGSDFTHTYDFNFIGECREKLTHDTYSTTFCFNVGPQKKMRGTVIPKLVLLLPLQYFGKGRTCQPNLQNHLPGSEKHRIGDKFYLTELLKEQKYIS